jgi:chromosome partitioning protein
MVISVAQRKGGVGKTTIAICVSAELARRGMRRSWSTAILSDRPVNGLNPAIWNFPLMKLGLRPISLWQAGPANVRKIKAEIVVIDTAPTEREMGASAALADIILVPCTASGLDIEATERTLGIIEAVRKRRREPMKVVFGAESN